MKNIFRNSIVAVVFLALLLSACGGGGSAPVNPASKFSAVSYAGVLGFNKYYHNTYAIETQYSAKYSEMWAYADTQTSGLKDMTYLQQNCWSNVKTVLKDATIGIYDTGTSANGQPNGVLNQQSMFSALVTNNLYPANADKCQQMMDETVQQIPVIHQNMYEKQLQTIEMRATLQRQYDGEIQYAVQRRLLDQYGQEFVQWMNDQLASHGIDPFPADFIGFPTSAVTANTRSQQWCSYYTDISTGMRQPSTMGMAPQMYGSSWVGPAQGGQCNLTRQAAWEYMGRMNLSQNTSNAMDCGQGMPSLSGNVDANCNEVPSTPLPKP